MIRFDSKDNFLIIYIEPKGCEAFKSEEYFFDVDKASCISQLLNKEFRSAIESVRKEAYELGYKDGKNKEKKIDRFNDNLNGITVGWK